MMTLTFRATKATAADKDASPQEPPESSVIPPSLPTPTDDVPPAPTPETTWSTPDHDSQPVMAHALQRTAVDVTPSSPLATSLFSPPASPPPSATTPRSPAAPSLRVVTSTPSPVRPSVWPLSPPAAPPAVPSATPAFLKATSQRRRPSASASTRKIPNTARVRSNTVGVLPAMDDRKRRRSYTSAPAVGLRNPPLSVTVPKRPRTDLSKLKFAKRSHDDVKASTSRSRSSSPEIPLSTRLEQPSRTASTSPRKSSSSTSSRASERPPYLSPAPTVTPASALPVTMPSARRDLFCDTDGCALRFYLDDTNRAQMATEILEHGGELAPEWDSTFAVRSGSESDGRTCGMKGGVTSCPLAVSAKWIKESLAAGKLLPTKPYTFRL